MLILKDSYIEKSVIGEHASIHKKHHSKDLEINIFTAQPGNNCFLLPPKSPMGIKTFHITRGSIKQTTKGTADVILKIDEAFEDLYSLAYTKYDIKYFKILEEVIKKLPNLAIHTE